MTQEGAFDNDGNIKRKKQEAILLRGSERERESEVLGQGYRAHEMTE